MIHIRCWFTLVAVLPTLLKRTLVEVLLTWSYFTNFAPMHFVVEVKFWTMFRNFLLTYLCVQAAKQTAGKTIDRGRIRVACVHTVPRNPVTPSLHSPPWVHPPPRRYRHNHCHNEEYDCNRNPNVSCAVLDSTPHRLQQCSVWDADAASMVCRPKQQVSAAATTVHT